MRGGLLHQLDTSKLVSYHEYAIEPSPLKSDVIVEGPSENSGLPTPISFFMTETDDVMEPRGVNVVEDSAIETNGGRLPALTNEHRPVIIFFIFLFFYYNFFFATAWYDDLFRLQDVIFGVRQYLDTILLLLNPVFASFNSFNLQSPLPPPIPLPPLPLLH